jgi:hypothetical protein
MPWSLNSLRFVKASLYGRDAFFFLRPLPNPRNSSRNLWTVSTLPYIIRNQAVVSMQRFQLIIIIIDRAGDLYS